MLQQGARRNHVNAVRILLQYGAEEGVFTSKKNIPLYLPAASSLVDVLQSFHEMGAYLDKPSHKVWSPLHAACYTNCFLAFQG